MGIFAEIFKFFVSITDAGSNGAQAFVNTGSNVVDNFQGIAAGSLGITE